ncbi:hypothetical protein HHO41_09180 [Bacillus sp. DNRA2]|uniref:hypothetical protein n=1 Tax=Bacillus sp. DNRA2 TaxID=2723053 RepID=UPI00145D8795|nr:hypothetical protein [Bacillus sp. DNRA2]NMD70463.1 hypothetical protein [Bacillus sp. DNRA2]
MKIDKLFVLLTIFFVSFTNMTVVYALDKQSQIMSSYKKDVTGDHHPEQVQVIKEGQKVKLVVNTGNYKAYSFSLGAAKKVKLIFQDLTQDRVKDIFLTSFNKNSNQVLNLLVAYENGEISNVSLPETLDITAQFENNYQASIKINQTKQSYMVNLLNYKGQLEKTGVYHNGALNEPTELMVSELTSLHIIRHKDLSLGLKGRQFVDDGYGGAKFAYVDSTWKRINANWELQKTTVRKIQY